jgi:hypothetical protein
MANYFLTLGLAILFRSFAKVDILLAGSNRIRVANYCWLNRQLPDTTLDHSSLKRPSAQRQPLSSILALPLFN